MLAERSNLNNWPRLSPHDNRPGMPQDRKSTRLNSSHDQISYAVFCLKKKNIERIPNQRDRGTLRRKTADAVVIVSIAAPPPRSGLSAADVEDAVGGRVRPAQSGDCFQ